MASKKVVNLVYSSDEDDDKSEEEESHHYTVVDSLKYSSRPELSTEELKFKNTFTYDKEPIKDWRQLSDYMFFKECNKVLWSKISNIIGSFHG